MQADISRQFVLLTQIDRGLLRLARWRAGALHGLLLAVLLLLFAGFGRPAQPMLAWLSGWAIAAVTLPTLVVSHLALRLSRDRRHALVRHLFRRGYRVDYPEFDHAGEPSQGLRAIAHAAPGR
jgi:hypothetical protein